MARPGSHCTVLPDPHTADRPGAMPNLGLANVQAKRSGTTEREPFASLAIRGEPRAQTAPASSKRRPGARMRPGCRSRLMLLERYNDRSFAFPRGRVPRQRIAATGTYSSVVLDPPTCGRQAHPAGGSRTPAHRRRTNGRLYDDLTNQAPAPARCRSQITGATTPRPSHTAEPLNHRFHPRSPGLFGP